MARLRLRPGVRAVRRPGGRLQVGIRADLRVLLPDQPATRSLLAELTGRTEASTPDDPDTRARLLERLREHDLLVPAGAERLGEALSASYGPSGPARRRLRAETLVDISAGWRYADRLSAELAAAGVGVAAAGHPGDISVLICAGEPRREDVDILSRVGRPHLLVSLAEGRALVGPFVVPGRSACLRCVDAHLTDRDPDWPLLAAQLHHGDDAIDPAISALAVAWAARDVVAWIDTGEPTTLSATVELGSHPWPRHRQWKRHPHCGCAWSAPFGSFLAGAVVS